MKYISLFSGIGGFELGIDMAAPNSECVGYAEVNEHAIVTYQTHFPTHKNLGDVTQIDFTKFKGIDLIVGGSPCQSLSIQTKNRQHLEGKSKLFFEFARALEEASPKHFILENVSSMSQSSKEEIIRKLEEVTGSKIFCTTIRSDHYTPQKRTRHFFTNFLVNQPTAVGERWPNLVAWSKSTRYPEGKPSYVEERVTTDGRANTCVTGMGCRGQSTCNYIEENGERRILTANECERLQGFPVDWTLPSPTRERFRQIGNAVTPAVVCHVVSHIAK